MTIAQKIAWENLSVFCKRKEKMEFPFLALALDSCSYCILGTKKEGWASRIILPEIST